VADKETVTIVCFLFTAMSLVRASIAVASFCQDERWIDVCLSIATYKRIVKKAGDTAGHAKVALAEKPGD
jgi:hypothetical protein